MLTNITVTKAYFTPFYYIKKDSLSKEKTLIKYMEDNGWVFQDRFGAILIFEKNDEIKRFNINKLISMF